MPPTDTNPGAAHARDTGGLSTPAFILVAVMGLVAVTFTVRRRRISEPE